MKSGDKVICISGNDFYKEGEIYTIGKFINERYFELLLGVNGDYWYASFNISVDDKLDDNLSNYFNDNFDNRLDDIGICVSFGSMSNYQNAYFTKLHYPYGRSTRPNQRPQL